MGKVDVMNRIALFTHRVARPIKFAAFISIVVSVAVMFVACQGAVGREGEKGEKGEKGDPGTAGTAGTPGQPGFTPLQVKGDAIFVTINDIDGDDENTDLEEAGEPVEIDLTNYFRGGTPPYDYGDPVRDGDPPGLGPVTAARVDDGPMYKFSVPADQTDGAGLNTWNVTITDGDGSTLTLEIKARRNDAPTGAETAVDATVGTQAPEMAPDVPPDCPAANECTSASVDFVDDNAEEILMFSAVSADPTKVVVVSVAPAPAADDADNAVVVVRGIASTWVADTDPDTADNQAGHSPVKVTVTATDRGGETAKRTLEVTVDGAPALSKAIPGGTLSQTRPQYVIENLTGFFTNHENAGDNPETVSFSAKSSDETVATAAFGTGDNPDDASGTRIVVSRVAPGSATITVTATESTVSNNPTQTGEGTFTVTVSD